MNSEELLENYIWVYVIIIVVIGILVIGGFIAIMSLWINIIKAIAKYLNKKLDEPIKTKNVYTSRRIIDYQHYTNRTIDYSSSRSKSESHNYNYDDDDDDDEVYESPRTTTNDKTCTSNIGGYACSPVSGGINFNNGRSATEDSYGNLYFDNGETAVKTSDGRYYFSDGKTGYEDSCGNIQLNDGQVIIKR